MRTEIPCLHIDHGGTAGTALSQSPAFSLKLPNPPAAPEIVGNVILSVFPVALPEKKISSSNPNSAPSSNIGGKKVSFFDNRAGGCSFWNSIGAINREIGSKRIRILIVTGKLHHRRRNRNRNKHEGIVRRAIHSFLHGGPGFVKGGPAGENHSAANTFQLTAGCCVIRIFFQHIAKQKHRFFIIADIAESGRQGQHALNAFRHPYGIFLFQFSFQGLAFFFRLRGLFSHLPEYSELFQAFHSISVSGILLQYFLYASIASSIFPCFHKTSAGTYFKLSYHFCSRSQEAR